MAERRPAVNGTGDGPLELLLEQRFTGRLAVLKKVRANVLRIARSCGFDDPAARDIVLAVDEACKNVIVHGYGGCEDGEIVLSIFGSEAHILFELRDFAPTVDPAKVKPRELTDLKPGKLGTHFIRTIMDSAEFLPVPEGGGNVLQMTKRAQPKQANGVTADD